MEIRIYYKGFFSLAIHLLFNLILMYLNLIQDFQNDDIFSLWLCNCIASALSFLGTLWTFYYCLKIRSPGNITLQIIVTITTADFLYTVSNILSLFQTDSESFLCALEAPFRELSIRLTLYFSTCLAIFIERCTKYGGNYDQNLFFRRALMGSALIIIYLSAW